MAAEFEEEAEAEAAMDDGGRAGGWGGDGDDGGEAGGDGGGGSDGG